VARPERVRLATAAQAALAYLGFATPYLVDGLGALVGKTALVVLTPRIAGLALRTPGPGPACAGRSGSRKVTDPSGGRPAMQSRITER